MTNHHKLTYLPLIGVMYFSVCGGAYGLEAVVSGAGAWWALVLVVVLPFLWAMPVALVVAELASAMPREGGAYAWSRDVLGPFWGAQTGWWALCQAIADMALYPVLFVEYLKRLAPTAWLDERVETWGVAVAMILVAWALNAAGVRAVGRAALAAMLLVMAPLLVAAIAILTRASAWYELQETLVPDAAAAPLLAGLAAAMWNYLGWENAATYMGEMARPQRDYPRALFVVALLALATYLLPLLAGLSLFPRDAWGDWTVWPGLGFHAGGKYMAVVVLVVGLLAQWGLFNSSLLSASRLPRVMAQDGWLPRVLARTDKRETPQLALAILALLACGLAALSFEKLVLVDVLLYSGVLATELAVVVKLRRAGAREGAFRVPGGAMGLAACIVSIGVCWLLLVAALAHEGALRAAGVELFVLATLVAAGLLLPRPIPENGTNRPEIRSGSGLP